MSIVVEGMDGSGKSSLVKRLSDDLGLPIHERASTSRGGPVSEIFRWARSDVAARMYEAFSVYDRHPLISEYIYGPICRGRIDPEFYTPHGHAISRGFASQYLIIYCDPGIDEIQKNLRASLEDQMTGVYRHSIELHYAYRTMMHYWPGDIPQVWDYTLPDTYPDVVQRCVEFMGIRKGDRP